MQNRSVLRKKKGGEALVWHVETDCFALAIFLIMLIKESPERTRKRDRQSNAFFLVLLFSIVNVTIDIISSLAVN